MEMNNSCRKFEPNMFNKTKCQNCFRNKEEHSSKALEHLRNTRKISKCAYLFVAPDSFDFTNQLDRTRRWQRRFFVLYDDGELTYSVDDNVDTIPQGVIDMNACTEVGSAESITGHQFSIAVITSSMTTYIKGNTQEEISRWQNILSVYPGSLKAKSKKTYEKSFSQPAGQTDSVMDSLQVQVLNSSNNSPQPTSGSSLVKASPVQAHGADVNYKQQVTSRKFLPSSVTGTAASVPVVHRHSFTASSERSDISRRSVIDSVSESGISTSNSSRYHGVRSLKHKNEKSHLLKANSLQDVTDGKLEMKQNEVDSDSNAVSDNDYVVHYNLHGSVPSANACLSPPSVCTSFPAYQDFGWEVSSNRRRSRGHERRTASTLVPEIGQQGVVSNAALFWEEISNNSTPDSSVLSSSCAVVPSSAVRNASVDSHRRARHDVASSRYSTICAPCDAHTVQSGTSNCYRRPVSMFETRDCKVLTKTVVEVDSNRSSYGQDTDCQNAESNSPATLQPSLPSSDNKDAVYIKKGWLLHHTKSEDWTRSWCVLWTQCLSVYRDTSDELSSSAVATVALSPQTMLSEPSVSRNFAFQLSNGSSQVVLAAASQGICRLWMDAINSCLKSCSTEVVGSCAPSSFPWTGVDCHCSSVEPDSPCLTTPCDGGGVGLLSSSSCRQSVCMSSGESDTKDVSSSSSHRLVASSRLPDTIASSLLKAESRHSYSSVSAEGDDSSDDDNSMTTDITSDNTMIELLETEVASLKRQLDWSQSQLMECQKINSDLSRQLLAANPDIAAASIQSYQQFEIAEFDKSGRLEVEKLQIQIKSLKRKLRQALKTTKSQKKEIESLQNQLSSSVSKSRLVIEASREAKEEKDRLQVQLSSLSKMKADLERREIDLTSEIKSLEKKLETTIGRAQNLRSELEGKNTQIEELLLERDHLAAQLQERIESDIEQANDAIRDLTSKEQENMQLRQDLNDLQLANSALIAELNKQTSIAASFNAECKRLKEDKSNLTSKILEKDDRISAVVRERENVKQKLDETLEENVRLQEINRKLDESCVSQQLQRKAKDLESQNFAGPKSSSGNTLAALEVNCQDQMVPADEVFADDLDSAGGYVGRQKQMENDLLQSQQQCSELRMTVNRLKQEQRLLEISHNESAARFKSEIEQLMDKLEIAERRCRELEADKSNQVTSKLVADIPESFERNNILSLCLSPLGPGDRSSQTTAREQLEENKEILSLRDRVSELESMVEAMKDNSGHRDAEAVSKALSSNSEFSVSSDRRIADLEKQCHDIQVDYDQELELQRAAHKRELTRTREEMMQLLTSCGHVDEQQLQTKYMKEIEHIKEVYDRGFSAMEKSHQRTIQELRSRHRQELEQFHKERDSLLEAEAHDTQAALKAMKKAHEVEMETERARYRELLSKTGSAAAAIADRDNHEDDVSLLRAEIRQLSGQYSAKCVESATLQKKFDDCQIHVRDLLNRNDELNKKLKYEIERLSRQLEQQRVTVADAPTDSNSRLQLQQLQTSVDLKQLQLLQVENELERVQRQLSSTNKELTTLKAKSSAKLPSITISDV